MANVLYFKAFRNAVRSLMPPNMLERIEQLTHTLHLQYLEEELKNRGIDLRIHNQETRQPEPHGK